MKLVIATPLYPPEIGGPATYAKILEEELPKRGFSVELVKFSAVRHLPNAIRHIAYARNVLRAARQADGILALDVLSVGWPAYFANLFLRKKLIVKIVGDHIWEQGKQRFGITDTLDAFPRFSWRWNPYLWFLRGLQLLVVHGARRVIVPSEYLKKIVTRWGSPSQGSGEPSIAPDKILVIYNGIELPPDIPVPEKKTGEFLIVSTGRRVPWKGFEAVEALAARETSWRVFIASDLPRREALGYVRAADVFVLNSSYEGLSHALIEAMMLGTPIVATDAGGNGELIRHEETGLLVPPGDDEALYQAVQSVADDPAAARSRAKSAQAFAKRLSPEAMVDSTAALLKEL